MAGPRVRLAGTLCWDTRSPQPTRPGSLEEPGTRSRLIGCPQSLSLDTVWSLKTGNFIFDASILMEFPGLVGSGGMTWGARGRRVSSLPWTSRRDTCPAKCPLELEEPASLPSPPRTTPRPQSRLLRARLPTLPCFALLPRPLFYLMLYCIFIHLSSCLLTSLKRGSCVSNSSSYIPPVPRTICGASQLIHIY